MDTVMLQEAVESTVFSDLENQPFCRLTFKASHNSYTLSPTLVEQITDFHCRGVELDINQGGTDNLEWSVGHMGGYYSDLKYQLKTYLGHLQGWHKDTVDFDPIVLYLDLKTVSDSSKVVTVDEYILQTFPTDIIYKPADMIGNCGNLYQGALINGWPTLKELRGKFILVITGNEDAKEEYANYYAQQQLCFTDLDLDADRFPFDPDSNRIFFNYADFNENIISDQAYNNASFVRTYPVSGSPCSAQKGRFEGALKYGINMISTDCIDADWAHVDPTQPGACYVPLNPLSQGVSKNNAFWLQNFMNDDLVTDLKNGSNTNGKPVGPWKKEDTYNQLWYENNGALYNKSSGTVLDLDNGDTLLQGWDYTEGSPNQRWELEIQEIYCLSPNQPFVSTRISADEVFKFLPLTPSDRKQFSDAELEGEQNLYLILTAQNEYLGYEMAPDGAPFLTTYPDKSNIRQLFLLRWNTRELASIMLFLDDNDKRYVGIQRMVLTIDSQWINPAEMLSILKQPEGYVICDSTYQFYFVKNEKFDKYVTFEKNQFEGRFLDNNNLSAQVWKRVNSGAAI